MARSTRLVILIKNICIYFMGSEILPSACYILSDESSIPFCSTSNGYNNKNPTFGCLSGRYLRKVLAIIEAITKFRVYLLGIPFRIVTDCNAFTKTLDKQCLCSRMTRWVLLLQEYDYKAR